MNQKLANAARRFLPEHEAIRLVEKSVVVRSHVDKNAHEAGQKNRHEVVAK